jgi:spore coat polysaccharide biosynthesis protein SpsF
MKSQPGIILQARFASTRLPGKALQTIRARTLLELCVERLRAGRDAMLVLATTLNPEDDALEALADDLGVPCFRGSADDVLGRYVAAAAKFRLDPIIRATGDNPAVDMHAPWRVLRALALTGADYVCENGLPIGGGVEGITYAALRRAERAAQLPYDREHVTTFVKSHPEMFNVLLQPAPEPLCCPSLRLTVDTLQDLQWMRRLFSRVETELPTLRRLIEAGEPHVLQEVA